MSFESGCDDEITIACGCPTQAGVACVGGFLGRNDAADPNEDSREAAMHIAKRLPLGNLSTSKMLCVVVVFCAAMAIASP
jgi:hypothetical protein